MHDRADSGRAWRFLALTLGWTWTAWWVGAASGWEPREGPGAALFVLGGLGPLVIALALLVVRDPVTDRRDYWQRLVQVRRLGLRGVLLALGTPALAAVFAAVIGQVLGWGTTLGGTSAVLSGTPFAVALALLMVLVLGPLPEELGWRGYALGPLQKRHSTLGAALVLAVVWALWHVPLFAWRGTYQHALGLVSGRGALFMVGLLVDSVLLAGLYNRTAGSTLGAIGYHFATNATGEMWPLPLRAQVVRLGCTAVLAALIVSGRGSRAPEPAAT